MKTSASGEQGMEIITTDIRRDKLGRRTLGRERRDELLARFATSGMTQAAFARKEGVSEQTFASWRKRVLREGKDRPAPTSYMRGVSGHPVQPVFREVSVTATEPVAPVVVTLPGGIEIRCDDVCTVVRLIRALREVC